MRTWANLELGSFKGLSNASYTVFPSIIRIITHSNNSLSTIFNNVYLRMLEYLRKLRASNSFICCISLIYYFWNSSWLMTAPSPSPGWTLTIVFFMHLAFLSTLRIFLVHTCHQLFYSSSFKSVIFLTKSLLIDCCSKFSMIMDITMFSNMNCPNNTSDMK